MSESGAELSCLHTVKMHERTNSFKIRTQDDDIGCAVRAASVIPNRVKPKWYPAEVVKVTGDCRQVKIYYTGYSKRYNEWIRKSQVGSMPVSLTREIHYHDVGLGAGLLFIVKSVSLLCDFIHDETCTSESHDTVEYFARVLQSTDRFTDLHDKKSLIHELLLLVDEADSPDGITTATRHLIIGIHSLKAMMNDLVLSLLSISLLPVRKTTSSCKS